MQMEAIDGNMDGSNKFAAESQIDCACIRVTRELARERMQR